MMRRIGPFRLVGMAAPMAVWALHFVLVYSLVGLGCEEGWHLRRIAGLGVPTPSLLTWSLLLATVTSLGVIAWLGARAWRGWRSLPVAGEPAASEPAAAESADALQRRHRFMSLATTIMALLAAIAVVFTTTPVFMLPSCT